MRLVEINPAAPPAAGELAAELEQGNIVFLPSSPLAPTYGEAQILSDINRLDTSVHKNIAYKPAQDKLTGLKGVSSTVHHDVHRVLRGHSNKVIEFLRGIIPQYTEGWRIDYASFRPQEEEGRDLPWKKRNDLLHVDAFPTRPTRGDLILRVFTNVNAKKARVWLTSEPFAWIAQRYSKDAGLEKYAKAAKSSGAQTLRKVAGALGRMGLPFRDRTPYDSFMLHFHDYLKSRADYQQSCPKYRFDFPPQSTWLTFTDIVPHAVLAGQFALEQTFLISRASLAMPEAAPAAILERIAGVSLTDA